MYLNDIEEPLYRVINPKRKEMNSQSKFEDLTEADILYKLCEAQKKSRINSNLSKPKQYQIGIDTFARAEANMNFEEIMACCRFNIDKYNWRVKGQDLEDFKKIIDYANFAIKQLEK